MSRKFKIGGVEVSLRDWWANKLAEEKAKAANDRASGWKDKIADEEDDSEEFKNVEFKINKKGEMEPVTDANPLGIDDIKVTGSKSSLRRIADLERNVTVLANRLSTIDEETDIEDGSESLFDNWITEETAFTKDVTIGKGSTSNWWKNKATGNATRVDIDGHLYINNGMTIGSTAQEVIRDLVGTMAGTGLTNSDSNNKINIDTSTMATRSWVSDEIADVVGGAPGALNTLNELAAALNDDSDFHQTVTNALSGKVSKTSAQAMRATNALTVSNDTITMHKADGTTESVTISDANTNKFLNDLDFNTSNGVLTATLNDGSQVSEDLDGRYALIVDFDAEKIRQEALEDYITDLDFNTSNGVLTATRRLGGTVTEDLDGRYSLIHSHPYDNYQYWTASDNTTDANVGSQTKIKWVGSGATSVAFDDTTNTFTISSTDTNTDTNTTYDLSAIAATGGAAVRLAGSDSTNDDVTFKGAGATTVSRSGNTITITSTDTNTDTDTWRPVVDNLTSTDTDKSLSAKQGKVLNDRITDLIGGAPDALNTLNELAAALNDNANFAGTITQSLSGKVGTNSAQALRSSNALTVNNDTITLHKGDGSTESVTISDAFENYLQWHAIDGDGTSYSITSQDSLTFREGGHIDINFTADDVLTFSVDMSAAYSYADSKDEHLAGLSFNTANGELTADMRLGSDITVDLDGRYSLIHSHPYDNYQWWRISDGTNGENITTQQTLKVVGSGAASTSYDAATNTLTINSTDTNTDTNTTYSLKAQQTGGTNADPNLWLDASSGTDDYVQLVGGTNVSVTRNDNGKITFASTDTNTTDWYVANSGGTNQFKVDKNEKVRFEGSGATSVSFDAATNKVIISSTDTDTNTWRGITSSLTSTSTSTSLSAKAGKDLKDAIDLIVGDGTAPDTLNSIKELATAIQSNDSEIATFATKTSAQVLRASDALTVSNDTITIHKGDGTSESVSISDANTWRPIHDTPVDGATTTSISSNWAFDNVKTAVPAGAVFTDTDTNNYVTGLSFNTGNGILTASRLGLSAVTVDLDGRYQLAGSYLTSESDTLQSVTTRGNTTNKDIIMTSTDTTTRLLQVGKSTNGSQGTGAIEVTQDGQHGGGISYNGDNTPGFVSSEGADRVTFYRMTTGTRSEVFSYAHNSDLVTFNGDITVSGGDVNATRFNGTATYAKYADLAERYAADAPYAEGTVVVFGGEAEVTASTSFAQRSVAGVVSLRPAVAMNAEAGNNETHPFIALQGRVPVKVTGDVKKGDILVASDVAGTATAWTNDDADPRMTAYVGIAISDAVDGFVEVKVGK